MKKFKLTKSVQITLVTIFMIIIAGIIVGKLSNDKAMAASPRNMF